jgi:hypothetical protein
MLAAKCQFFAQLVGIESKKFTKRLFFEQNLGEKAALYWHIFCLYSEHE